MRRRPARVAPGRAAALVMAYTVPPGPGGPWPGGATSCGLSRQGEVIFCFGVIL